MKLPHPFIRIAENPIIDIAAPEDGKIRARKVVKRSNARPTGKFFSWKSKRMIQWESIHELHAFRLLDADPTVISFGEQPMTIDYIIHNTETFHVPDILVRTKAGWEVWEVKAQSEAKKEDVLNRTRLMAEALPSHGYLYRLVIGEDLAREPRQSSVQLLLKYGRDDIAAVERESLRRHLSTLSSLTWGEVKEGVLGSKSREHACRLMLEGEIGWDSELPLLHQTPLALPHQENGDSLKWEA